MKPRVLLLLVALVLAGALAADAPGTNAPETRERVVLEEIVARVNNEIITWADLERGRALLRRELGDKLSGAALEQRFQTEQTNLLRDLIDQTLLVQRGTEMGLPVEPEIIKRLDRIRQEMGLATMEDLERAVAAQGMDFEEYRLQLRNQILTQMVVQRDVASRVMINSEDVRQYYLQHREELAQPERLRLREILVSTRGTSPADLPAREERVREVLTKIRQGGKFEELARTYSDSPTAADGGELGYFELARLAPEIRAVVEKLREGGVGDPIRTADGFLILQLVEHLPAGIPPFEKVENELTQKLYYDQVQPAMRDYLSTLRREAFIYVKSGYMDTGAVAPEPKPVRRGSRRRQRRH